MIERSPQRRPAERASRHDYRRPHQDVGLIDLIDRLLDGGVVLAGDITLAAADVDLVYVGLRALISSVATAERKGIPLPR